ncbi:HET-domain-containing protein [Daldinia sp. FL1419]|nr:HET-domain-containing protein [Daldinia sp. FL1419]
MLCHVCRGGLEGIWDPKNKKRLGLIKSLPLEISEKLFEAYDDEIRDQILNDDDKLKEPERYLFGHHTTYDSVLESMRLGCVVCCSHFDDDDADDINPTFTSLGYFSVFCVQLHPKYPDMIVGAGERVHPYKHPMVIHDRNDTVNSVISRSTADTSTWAFIRRWVYKCVKSHELCRRQVSEVFSPTRLLELQHRGAKKKFRLVLHNEFNPNDRYITLSHCWGPEPADKKLRLLKNTLEVLRKGLPVAILPKTFRHAFQVIERLGIRYLWIDRLCIIQDSKEDWQAEASTMAPVYSHGLLNIAALGATDDQSGCFFDRDPELIAPTIVKLSSPREKTEKFYRFEDEESSWKKDFEGEPLILRAWVVQERILSARNLYFGSRQVFWECIEANCCETHPDSTPISLKSRGKLEKAPWKPLIEHKNSTTGVTTWKDVIETYSGCKLTFSEDKLVALSGLAKRMGGAMGRDSPDNNIYLAGLWKHHLPGALLWRTKVPGRRPSSYRAPSWSWASLDGDIAELDGATSPWSVQILKAETTPKGDDITGEITGGVLTVRGYICTGQDVELRKMLPRINDRPICLIRSLHHSQTGIRLGFSRSEFTGIFFFDTLDDIHESITILILHIRRVETFDKIEIRGLALLPVDRSQSSYRRVGFVRFDDYLDFEDSYSEKDIYDELTLKTIELI